jgi:hypothetical protein
MNHRIKITWKCSIALLTLALVTACGSLEDRYPIELTTVPPTAPATLIEVIETLSGPSAEARMTAAYAVPRFGAQATAAVPALIQNLYYETNSDVRKAAAFALGEIGSDARSAVPALTDVLQADDSENARRAAAEALGQIGESSAVPSLAAHLYDENMWLTLISARSLALIVGEGLPVDESTLNEEGTPLLVVAARKWWEEKGKLQHWGSDSN